MMVLARDERGDGLSDGQLRDELATLITARARDDGDRDRLGRRAADAQPGTCSGRRARHDDAYLDALAKEVLRVRSPIPIAAARYLSEPFPIGRWTIPPGVPLIVDAYGVHHDPDVYPEPDAFRPERFLTEQPDAYSFVPFGGGAHRCVGATLALLEIRIFLARDPRSLRARAALSAKEARPVPRAVTLAPRGGARVRVLGERRHRSSHRVSANAASAASP